MRHLVKWLGAEANSRAVTGLIAIGTLIGGACTFVFLNVLPLISPSLATGQFGDGYRTGQREAELRLQRDSIREQLRAVQRMLSVPQKYCSMTDDEKQKEVIDALGKGSF